MQMANTGVLNLALSSTSLRSIVRSTSGVNVTLAGVSTAPIRPTAGAQSRSKDGNSVRRPYTRSSNKSISPLFGRGGSKKPAKAGHRQGGFWRPFSLTSANSCLVDVTALVLSFDNVCRNWRVMGLYKQVFAISKPLKPSSLPLW